MGGQMFALSSTGEVLAGLARAAHVEVTAYTLRGDVLYALEAAARRGACVEVALESRPYNDPLGRLAAQNRNVVERLRDAGAEARLADPVHAKEIAMDGTLYLDDKNWGLGDLVLRAGDAADVRSVATTKGAALDEEARLLRDARGNDGVVVASESFGCCNAVHSALEALAREGLTPRLIVSERDLRRNGRERAVLDNLVREGVRVRVCKDSEKLAVAGEGAWIGSANATVARGRANLPDWGLCSDDPRIVAAVRARIEAEWTLARPFKAGG
jgi:hypothetical protein